MKNLSFFQFLMQPEAWVAEVTVSDNLLPLLSFMLKVISSYHGLSYAVKNWGNLSHISRGDRKEQCPGFGGSEKTLGPASEYHRDGIWDHGGKVVRGGGQGGSWGVTAQCPWDNTGTIWDIVQRREILRRPISRSDSGLDSSCNNLNIKRKYQFILEGVWDTWLTVLH